MTNTDVLATAAFVAGLSAQQVDDLRALFQDRDAGVAGGETEGGAVLVDTDGLEIVKRLESENRWPFRAATTHRGWDYDDDQKLGYFKESYRHYRLFRFTHDDMSRDIFTHWDRAVVALLDTVDRNRIAHASSSFRKVIDCEVAPAANADDQRRVTADHMIKAMSCVYLGMILIGVGQDDSDNQSSPVRRIGWFYKNEREAVKFFKKGAIAYDFPPCKHFYGRSLIQGTGGIIRNIPRGIALLREAGAARIGEAYFELGLIFEGFYGEIKDLEIASVGRLDAIQCFQAAKRAYAFNNASECYPMWKPEIGTMPLDLNTPDWQLLRQEIGETTSSRLGLSAATQAFLFSAAAGLSKGVQPDHYAPLLILLPILGIVLAFTTWLHWVYVLNQNQVSRSILREKNEAKVGAYVMINKTGLTKEFNIVAPTRKTSWSLLLLESIYWALCMFFQGIAHIIMTLVQRIFWGVMNMFFPFRFIGEFLSLTHLRLPPAFETMSFVCENLCCEKGDGTSVEIKRHLVRVMLDQQSAQFTQQVLEFFTSLAAFSFIGVWLVLLVNEILSFQDGCGHWWSNTCMS